MPDFDRFSDRLSESLTFFQQFRDQIATVGSVLPTSRFASAAMAAECARDSAPKRILEVGAGTGAITAEIVRVMRPEDRLVSCELNHEFAAFLRRRFDEEPEFNRVRSQAEVREGSILDLVDGPFDYIISAIPFNNCPPDFVESIFAHYKTLLRPGGVLSYIEYVGGRALKRIISGGEGANGSPSDIEAVNAIVERELAAHEFRRDTVVRNIPPAWIHNLRFEQPDPVVTAQFSPLAGLNRFGMGEFGVDTDAAPFLLGLGGLAWALRKLAPKSKAWLLPAAAVPLTAAFFRDPARDVYRDSRVAYSSADGVVLAVETLTDSRFGPGEWLRISAFLSITDVHVNRAPVAGRVVDVVQESGGYAIASSAEAERNESQYTVIENAQGKCVVAQRVGAVARRIVNRVKPGMLLAQGDKFGLIRFGSRTDVYLPKADWRASVYAGDRLVGGTTVIARLN